MNKVSTNCGLNNKTNWNTYRNIIENEIECNPPGNYQELEQIVYSRAMKTIGLYKHNTNQIYNNKNIKKARQQKRIKKNYNKQSKQKIIWKLSKKIISIESHMKI